jgi:hypothetical protein
VSAARLHIEQPAWWRQRHHSRHGERGEGLGDLEGAATPIRQIARGACPHEFGAIRQDRALVGVQLLTMLKVVPAPFGPISQRFAGLELEADAVAAPFRRRRTCRGC